MVNHRDSKRKGVRRWVILVQACVLIQCSANCSIARKQCYNLCLCVKEGGPFYRSREEPYRGDLFSTRERERD